MILWHNTKLKTIGAIMSTGCCRCCSAAVLSVLSVACLVFISPTFLSIYTFTDSPTAGWLCAPLFRLWAECSHENKQLPVCTLCSPALCHSYFGQISQNPSRLKMLHTAPHTSHSEPDRIIMSHTTQNINLMPDASVYIRVFSSAFISGDFSHALKNGPPRPILYWKVGHQSRFTIKKYAII